MYWERRREAEWKFLGRKICRGIGGDAQVQVQVFAEHSWRIELEESGFGISVVNVEYKESRGGRCSSTRRFLRTLGVLAPE